MFCNNCGQEIDDNSIICPHCGIMVENPNAINTTVPQTKTTNVCAIVGFVLSLVSGIFSYIPLIGAYISWAAFIAAFVLSIVGIKNANNKGQNLKGLAIAGLVICCIDLIINIIALAIIIIALVAVAA